MTEIERIAKRIGVLQGKRAYGLFAFLYPYDSKKGGYPVAVNLTKNGKYADTDKGGIFPSRKHARDYIEALKNEYNISDDDITILNIVSTTEIKKGSG